jgi:hypothetical protein
MPNKRPVRILLMGYPYFVNRLRELAKDADFVFLTLPRNRFGKWWALLRADLIYLIGGDLRRNRFYNLAFLFGKKIIIHWVGSDILEMAQWRKQGKRFSSLLLNKAEHWAEVEWTATELADLGVKARVMPLTPTVFPEKVNELPQKLVVLTYLPTDKGPFYGEQEVLGLANQFPEIVFLAAATSSTERNPDWPSNIIPIGWVNNMSELYREVIALVRLTKHDGLSFMVLEALAQARYVLWSYPLTGATCISNYEEAAWALDELNKAFNEGRLTLNWSGREYVEKNYSPEVVWEQINQGILAIVER